MMGAEEPNWLDELRVQTGDRRDPWVVLEGVRAVEGALMHWWDVRGVLAASNCEWEPPEWSGLDVLRPDRAELEAFSDYRFHRGVLGLARIPEECADVAGLLAELDEDALVIVCPRLGDGSNVGAIIRNAAALGAQAAIFGNAGVSPFERKSVRASSGALFQLPVRFADSGQILRCLRAAGFALLGVGGRADEVCELDRLEPAGGRLALAIGSETDGLGSFWQAACDERVRIPVAAGAESMNAAAASAVCLWEIQRRRAVKNN